MCAIRKEATTGAMILKEASIWNSKCDKKKIIESDLNFTKEEVILLTS